MIRLPSQRTPQTLGAVAFGILLVVAAVGGAPGLAAGQEDVPASYYGEVEINGDPAPEGTEIAAVVDGEVKDTIVVETAGEYGGSDLFDEKLVVEEPSGETTVEFVVGDVTADETAEWEAGAVSQVNLTFEGVDDDSIGDSAGSDDGTDDADDTDDAGGNGAPGSGGADSDDDSSDDPTDTDADGTTDTGADDTTDAVDDTSVETIQESEASIDGGPDTERPRASFGADEPVESISFDSDAEGSVSVTTSDGTPDGVEQSPGAAVQVSQITVPDEARDSSATIRTSVDADRVTEFDADADSLGVFRLVDGEWQSLETTVVDNADDRVVLEAETPGFSYFSVSATGEPDAAAVATPSSVTEGEDVTLDGSDSTDEYGEIVAYEWNVDDETLTGETATVTVDEPGEYTAELTVTNNAGETDTATLNLSVGEATDAANSEESVTGEQDDVPDEEPAGLGMTAIVGVLVAVVVAVIAVGAWRRGSDDDPLR